MALAASAVPVGASCVAPGGAGGCFASIQAAVDAAARNEIIDIMAGTYAEAVSVPASARLTLHGAGVGATIIDGGVLTSSIVSVSKNARVAIEDLTLQNGAQGGLFTGDARVTVSRCRLSGNSAGGGGAIRLVGGVLTVVDTTLDGNHSTQGFGDGGGAIFVDAQVGLGKLELRRSTVSGNSAAVVGGGILIQSRGRALLVDSTITGNSAPEAGAVECVVCRRLTLVNCTVTENSSTAPPAADDAGAVVAGAATMQWANSIVAGNTAPAGGPECSGNLRSRGYNLIGGPGLTAETVGCNIVNDDPTDLIGVDPMLGPLASNGGPTQTQALLAGSPAIDAGDPRPPADHATRYPTTDQRGVARNGRRDIGAFEY